MSHFLKNIFLQKFTFALNMAISGLIVVRTGRYAYKSMGGFWAAAGRTGFCMRCGMRGDIDIGAIGIGGRKGTGERCIPFPNPMPIALPPIPILIPIPIGCIPGGPGGKCGWNEGGAENGCRWGGTPTPPPRNKLIEAAMRSRALACFIFETASCFESAGRPEAARSSLILCHLPE